MARSPTASPQSGDRRQPRLAVRARSGDRTLPAYERDLSRGRTRHARWRAFLGQPVAAALLPLGVQSRSRCAVARQVGADPGRHRRPDHPRPAARDPRPDVARRVGRLRGARAHRRAPAPSSPCLRPHPRKPRSSRPRWHDVRERLDLRRAGAADESAGGGRSASVPPQGAVRRHLPLDARSLRRGLGSVRGRSGHADREGARSCRASRSPIQVMPARGSVGPGRCGAAGVGSATAWRCSRS